MYSISTFVHDRLHRKEFIWRFQAIKTGMPVKKIVPLLILFCGISLLSFSQNTIFTGTVIDEESATKLADALVTIEKTAFVQTTGDDGQFKFNQVIPQGEHVVSIAKEGYEIKYFSIKLIQGKKLVVNAVKLEMTKEEKKRQKKLEKSTKKERKKAEKEKEAKIKEVIKEAEKTEKKLAKEKNGKKGIKWPLEYLRGNKEPDVVVTYEEVPEETEGDEELEEIITPLQEKYAQILGITPEEITNTALYTFIDKWMNTPYLMGGETEAGIDCSSFAQRLFGNVYGMYIERTAQKQMDSEDTVTWSDPKYLKEGDFVFFRAAGDKSDTITHVGVYLGNNKFVNATSRAGTSGSSGVKISDLLDLYWSMRLFAGGRRANTKK